MVNFKDLHFKDFASVATWGYVAGNCPPRNSSLSTLESLMAPTMHPIHQPP